MLKFKGLMKCVIPFVFLIENGFAIELTARHAQILNESSFVNHMNDSRTLNLTLWFNIRNKERFDQLVNDIYNPTSSRYQQF